MVSEDVCHRHYKILAEFRGFLQVHYSPNIPKMFKIHTVCLVTMLCFVKLVCLPSVSLECIKGINRIEKLKTITKQ